MPLETEVLSQLLTVAEVAEILRVQPRRVGKLLDSGELPYVHISARVRRVRRQDLAALLEPRNDHEPAGGGLVGKVRDAGAQQIG